MIAWTMPDALELLTTRRSFKAAELAGPVPSATEIDTLLTVASRVPDHGKLVPWRFIVFEGEARRSAGGAIAAAFRAKYPDARPEHVEAERERLVRAPLVIAVVSRAGPHVKIPEWEQVLSAGAAAMSLVLAAHALGYGANWITEWYAYDRGVVGLRRAFSPAFPAGGMVFFVRWRVVAEESGAAHFGFGGAMLLDLPGPALRLLTDVADFHFSDNAVRGDDGARAIGANDDAAAVELRGRRRQHP
jgi:nitroreductase